MIRRSFDGLIIGHVWIHGNDDELNVLECMYVRTLFLYFTIYDKLVFIKKCIIENDANKKTSN